jgi:hypothetical protein
MEIRIGYDTVQTQDKSARLSSGCVALFLPKRRPATTQQMALASSSQETRRSDRPKSVNDGGLGSRCSGKQRIEALRS